METIAPIIDLLSGAPLHVILGIAVVILWRKVNDLEKALLDCEARTHAAIEQAVRKNATRPQ